MFESSNALFDRSAAPVIGIVLLVGVAIVIATVVSVVALGLGEDVDDSQPPLSVEATFDAREPLDPHWIFKIRHKTGENINEGELRIKLVDEFGNEANRTYPEPFTAGDTIRMGLWGSPNRATKSGVDCTLNPQDPPGANNDQLVAVSPPAKTVNVVLVHEPSNSLLDQVEVDLGDYPDRFGTRLLDGSNPSFDCNDVQWRSGTVVPAD